MPARLISAADPNGQHFQNCCEGSRGMRARKVSAKKHPPIPVLRPLLPAAERLLPYLRAIDASRVYSNHGPLVTGLARRLAGKLRVSVGFRDCTVPDFGSGSIIQRHHLGTLLSLSTSSNRRTGV